MLILFQAVCTDLIFVVNSEKVLIKARESEDNATGSDHSGRKAQ